jgi:N-acetylglucosaminyldiphosphoundecaprenol N-acetyl-beta-D-mannosaminyltransferase
MVDGVLEERQRKMRVPEISPPPRVNVLGVRVSVLDMERAVAHILAMVKAREPRYVCVVGVHGVSEAQDDPRFKQLLNQAALCTPDGMPMVWLGKLAGHAAMGRVYGPDLMLALGGVSAQHGLRHFFYGGHQGVADRLARRMQERFPGLIVAGTYTPPFRPLNAGEEAALERLVEAARPDVFWVGLGAPKQEHFMRAYHAQLGVPVMIGVGAAFDIHAGLLDQAPRWIQRSGLEWSYRLYKEPRRLWKRYLRNNPLFVGRIFLQITGLKRYDTLENQT